MESVRVRADMLARSYMMTTLVCTHKEATDSEFDLFEITTECDTSVKGIFLNSHY